MFHPLGYTVTVKEHVVVVVQPVLRSWTTLEAKTRGAIIKIELHVNI